MGGHIICRMSHLYAFIWPQVCRANGGVYVKAGQFAAAFGAVPPEYRKHLALLQVECVSECYCVLFWLFCLSYVLTYGSTITRPPPSYNQHHSNCIAFHLLSAIVCLLYVSITGQGEAATI